MIPALQRYVYETLNANLNCKPWAQAGIAPYFLRDAFVIWETELMGLGLLIAAESSATRRSISDIASKTRKLGALAQKSVVYATDALASYERKRLIELKVPFIVPGNQLYLPDIGLDLREYFRQRAGAADDALSPSAQAMLITSLLQSATRLDHNANEITDHLGYSAMTRSRALRELVATGIAVQHKVGRSSRLTLATTPRETWEGMQPLLRNPIKRTVWAYPADIPSGLEKKLAGESALSRLTMLEQPRHQTYAASHAAWRAVKAIDAELPEAMPGAEEWQLWSYSPTLAPQADCVDPYSLILSLRESADERIQQALSDIREKLQW